MRTIRDQVIQVRLSGKLMKVDFNDQKALNFYNWINQQPDNVLSQNIINLRRMYIQEYNDISE
jgi:hypothetical protein